MHVFLYSENVSSGFPEIGIYPIISANQIIKKSGVSNILIILACNKKIIRVNFRSKTMPWHILISCKSMLAFFKYDLGDCLVSFINKILLSHYAVALLVSLAPPCQ